MVAKDKMPKFRKIWVMCPHCDVYAHQVGSAEQICHYRVGIPTAGLGSHS